MAQQDRNGRNVAVPDENRPSWRPTDEVGRRNRRSMSEDDDLYARDREEDDRYMGRERGRYSHWDERRERDEGYRPRDEGYRWRDEGYGYRPTERYGQGQSGYGAGRYEDDRSYSSRNLGYPRGYDDRPPERGLDERFDRDRRYGSESGYGQGEEGSRMRGQHQEGGMYGHGPGSWNDRSQQRPSHRGKGPASYTRSDERIREAVCEALTDDHDIDATHIDITVRSGEVILGGTVDDRRQKRLAEECAEQITGVKDVQNQLRIATDQKDSSKTASNKDTETSTMGISGSDKRHRA